MRELEQELDNWRKECCDNLMQQVRHGTRSSVTEAAMSYKVAIDMHTIEYRNNREKLSPYIRNGLKW